MNKFYRYFVLVLLLSSACNVNAEERYFKYSSIVTDWSSVDEKEINLNANIDKFFIDTKEKIVVFGHSGHPYSTCTEDWSCIVSFELNFALPKNWTPLVKSWSYAGFLFLNKGSLKIEMFGITKTVQKIEAVNQTNDVATSNPTLIYYSSNDGILGVTRLWYNSEIKTYEPQTYWLSGKKGFEL